ncbi:hypothetical protein F2Q68_00033186 [Brassica cretica]|uniref:Uncharacterized protein n=1 Tax=Brassica cretica TaxID=69181 RepID=A0A8S9GEK9_BRACR|nr:hypothetical protein F2Q68_00033186 [Brassica cretica]
MFPMMDNEDDVGEKAKQNVPASSTGIKLAHCGSGRFERPRRMVGNSRSKAGIGSKPLINMFGDKKVHYPQGESCWEEDKHMFGTERLYNTVKMELETYMDYDDWNLAQNIIVNRCDPLPTSRCLARAS